MPRRSQPRVLSFLVVFLSACQPFFLPAPTDSPTILPSDTSLPSPTASPTPEVTLNTVEDPTLPPTLMATPPPTASLEPSLTPMPTDTPLPAALLLDPADWHHWPVIPIVPEYTRKIYLLGQSLGNDPHAFSVLGDCQSEPDVFMGSYETDLQAIATLPPNLQETVAWFSGSFNRQSPTVRGGTTTGATALADVAPEQVHLHEI